MSKVLRWVAIALCAGLAASACSRGDAKDEAAADAAAPAPEAPAAPAAAGVTRYEGAEIPESGQATIRATARARAAADNNAAVLETLHAGTSVTRVARHGGHTLVGWRGANGPAQGWVDSQLAFSRPIVDAGAGDTVLAPLAPDAGAAKAPAAQAPAKPNEALRPAVKIQTKK